MFKNKSFIIGLAVGIVILLFLSGIFFVIKNNQTADSDFRAAGGEKQEADEIKNSNTGALAEAQKQKVQPVRALDENDHVKGRNDAKVKMIVYSDFECPFCEMFTETLNKAEQEFGDNLVIAFRHYPLPFHEMALPAALASECAAEQNKFWEMHDRLFADNKAGNMTIEQFKKDAADLKLDKAKFNQCLDTEKYKDKIQTQLVEGRNFGVTGTPASFINGEVVVGAYPFEDFTDQEGRTVLGVKNIITKYLNQ